MLTEQKGQCEEQIINKAVCVLAQQRPALSGSLKNTNGYYKQFVIVNKCLVLENKCKKTTRLAIRKKYMLIGP